MWPLLPTVLTVLWCFGCGPGKSAEAPATGETTGKSPAAVEAPPAKKARPRSDELVDNLGCRTTEEELNACLARGSDCEMTAPPRVNRCRNRGARCLDDERIEPPGRCSCYCGDEYSEAYRRLNPPRKDKCYKRKNLATGKVEEHCEPPDLPR